ncbi:MAG: DNA-3-methyladenine glycosylase [Candidatus Pacebacteria bacterium]|nr:DNA-3-methyladenine glycosylase [Candidatus Paceibacterota bacterium]
MKILGQKFFNRPVVKVSEELLGKYLVRKIGNREVAYKITEVEAYDGEKDLASHSSKGRTPRTEVLYGEAGYFYVYLCYGMYWMLNIVTEKKDYPSAILIRGIDGFDGPGKLTRKLKIDRKLNGKSAEPASKLWVEDRGEKIDSKQVKKTPRIGVAYAGPIWSKKKYRFVLSKF